MTVALQFPYTDRAGVTHPAAVLEITTFHLEMSGDRLAADFEVDLYHDDAARQSGKDPFEHRDAMPLTLEEIQALQLQFGAAVYTLLAQRAEFAGGSLIGLT